MVVHLAISFWFSGYLTAVTVNKALLQNLPLPVVCKPATRVLFFLFSYEAFEIVARTIGPALLAALKKSFGFE
jgi:hypothetical protein